MIQAEVAVIRADWESAIKTWITPPSDAPDFLAVPAIRHAKDPVFRAYLKKFANT